MEKDDICRAVEAILFAAGDPVPAGQMASAIGVTEQEVEEAGTRLSSRLAYERAGVRVLHLEGDFQMVSAPECGDIVAHALETRKPPRLSAAALETLTIIAYYQPTTKAFVEQIRGVDSSYTMSSLLRRDLIIERGKLKAPGRPILYGTTDTFLRTFGLRSIQDLPEAELPRDKLSLKALEDEARQTLAKKNEEAST